MSEHDADRRKDDGTEETEESGDGGVDAVSILYIVGGIPAMVAFFVVLFTLVRFFPSIPA